MFKRKQSYFSKTVCAAVIGLYSSVCAGILPAIGKDSTVKAQSFYGAYLAGSYAASAGSPLATPYLRLALSFRPHDKIIRRELLLNLIDSGDYSSAIRLAHIMRQDNDATITPIVQLILATDAIKSKQYRRVDNLIENSKNKGESLLWVFITSWAHYGLGEKAKALQSLKQANLSEWYVFLATYNTALMLDLSNDSRRAAAAYQDALHHQRLVEIAPETYEHLIWAYASFLQRTEGKDAALKMLSHVEENLAPNNIVLQTLRANLSKGKTIPRLVTTPAQGAAEFAYDIGSTFLRAGEDLYADIYLQTAVFLEPNNDAALFRLGVLATKTKMEKKAERIFTQIPKNSIYYDDMQLLTALSISQSLTDNKDKKKNKEVAAKLEKMIAQDPNKTILQNILANIYLQTENYPAALKILDRLIGQIKQPQKDNWSIFFQRAIAYEKLKNWNKAEADFQESLKLNPKNADVLNYYGYSLIDRGLNLEYGLDLIRQAVAIQPRNGAIMDSLGWAYYKLGRYDEALTALEKAIQFEPGDSSVNDHLGDAYWETGHKLQAVFQWNHALAYGPEQKEIGKIHEKLRYGLQNSEEKQSDKPAAANSTEK